MDRFDLFIGRITELVGKLTADEDRLSLHAVDEWNDQLDQRIATGAPSTVGQFIDRITTAVGTSLLRNVVGPATLGQSLRFDVTDEMALRAALERLNQHHQIIARQCFGAGGWKIELRDDRHGRPVVLGQGDGPGGSAITARTGSQEQRRPVKHIVRADGEQVESTFELIPAWSGADESGADTDYARSTSSDWPRFANVYRLWLLNETGELGEPAFELETLIGDGRTMPADPLPFGPCLTQDASAQRLEPVVEFSVDDGANWQAFTGRYELLEDRAGLRFTDDGLPTSYFTAARGGLIRLRITASVRSPLPIERVRWVGNPFAGPFEVRAMEARRRFEVRRVLDSSRFASDVASGQRTADEVDDRLRMDQMLVDTTDDAIGSRARVYRLSRAMPGLSIGDRIIDGLAESIVRLDQPVGAIARIEHRWDEAAGTTVHVS